MLATETLPVLSLVDHAMCPYHLDCHLEGTVMAPPRAPKVLQVIRPCNLHVETITPYGLLSVKLSNFQ
jgi:hypothetical protein